MPPLRQHTSSGILCDIMTLGKVCLQCGGKTKRRRKLAETMAAQEPEEKQGFAFGVTENI